MAKLYHPDVNPSPAAAQMFIKVNIAYEILMDYKEGGSPTYKTTTSAPDPSSAKFHGSKFTHAEMNEAWAKRRQRERDAYEAYLNLPWYSGVKLEESFLKSLALFFAVILMGPIVLFFAGLSIFLLIDGSIVPAILTAGITGVVGYLVYKVIKMTLND